jgi:hypothetical protein
MERRCAAEGNRNMVVRTSLNFVLSSSSFIFITSEYLKEGEHLEILA